MKIKLNLVMVLVLLSFVGSVFAQEQRCVPPPSQMVAWFPFDESSGTTVANKISGGNPGTINGTSAWLNPGKVANALNLTQNGFVQAANQPQLNFGRGDFSIDAWIRIRQGNNGVRMIVDKRSSNLVGYLFFVYQNNKLGLQIGDTNYANYLSQNISTLTDGNWHHVAVTVDRDSATGVQFYFDGQLSGTANPTARNGDLTNSDPMRIGSEAGTGNFINGGIDELELFNRVLNREEIRTLFNAQGFGKCKEIQLGCCKCLGESNSLDLSTIPSNNWTVNGNPVVFLTSINNYWNLPTSTAKWVSTVMTGSTSIPGGTYEYKLQFKVPNCTIDQKVTLSGNYGGDDDVKVFLDNTNGAPISQCSGGWCFNTQNTPTPFNVTVTGPNHTLIVRVQNSGASPSGMFVNAKLTGTCSSKMTKSEGE